MNTYIFLITFMPVFYFFIIQNIITNDLRYLSVFSFNADTTLSKLKINDLTNYFNKNKLAHDKVTFNYSIHIFKNIYIDIISSYSYKNQNIIQAHYTKGDFYLTINNQIWKLNSTPILFEKIFDNHPIFLFNEIIFI